MTSSQFEILKTFKGIGSYSAIVLLIEIGDINRFPTVKHFASFLGLHPVYKQSGDGTWAWHMSKQGRKKARAISYMIAFSAMSNNLLIRDLYHRYRSKGKCHHYTLGICMHKICRIIYAMLKHNQPFDETMDRKNQKNFTKLVKPQRADVRRRYHEEDSTAPISYRQAKKRKERERSQSDPVTVNEIQIPAPSACN